MQKFTSILKINQRHFIRMASKRKLMNRKEREETQKEVITDDKMIKLTKKESLSASEVYLEELRKQSLELAPTYDKRLESELKGKARKDFEYFRKNTAFDLVNDPLFSYNKMKETINKTLDDSSVIAKEKEEVNKESFEELDVRKLEGNTWKEMLRTLPYMNIERIANEKFKIKKRENVPYDSKRVGVLAYKVGMTHTWDKWGTQVPLTVLQMENCQVIDIKTIEKDGYSSLVVGSGSRSLNRINRNVIGRFLKNEVAPKLDVVEFRIDPENALPIGYTLGVRHLTVGQWVDVQARSKGKGFQGVMKRFGFSGLPASHGTTLKHRSGGSIGGTQDPGRVWKRKKMPGRMGYDKITIRKLQVYKVDYERSLIYIRGPVPGCEGRLVKLYDSFYHSKMNKGIINYPTFVYEEGKDYANVVEVAPAKDDPSEIWLHDNVVPKDDDDEGGDEEVAEE